MSDTKATKVLRLTVDVPGVWADDLDECAAIYAGGDAPDARDRLNVVTEEWMREDVVVVFTTIPGEKSMSDDFSVEAVKCRIVGAEAVEA